MQSPNDSHDLGRCCACEKRGPDVRNIMMLNQKAPIPGTGWGCFVCHLPADGAVAVICDNCLESEAAILFVCVGYPGQDQRALVDDLEEPFEHDLARHELIPTPEMVGLPLPDPETDELSDEDFAEADEVNRIVDELLKRRCPDGPDDDVDWGSLYAEAEEELTRRALVGTLCPKCGKPLPPDLLCDCETWQELPEDDRAESK